ncbi:MAG: type II toxin-antitoxin system Phd/YefM family antitoxin [Spartobacteria bacterium]|nr:type II toxin-antitoxin system Phd/YefM family antitoxin [Spartobacteria bacterium]
MVTASALRKNIYHMLDEVLESGRPLEVNRKGRILKISIDNDVGSRLKRIRKHDSLTVDPEELVHLDWSEN